MSIRPTLTALMLALAVLASTNAAWALDIRKERVHFTAGAGTAQIKGRLTGREVADYLVAAKAGQTLTATLSTRGTMYFNVLVPGVRDGSALFVGSMADTDTFTTAVPRDGDYAIRLYMMGNDKDAGTARAFTLDVRLSE